MRGTWPANFGAGVHIHVAEDAVDEEDSVARFGKRVVERFVEHGALDEPRVVGPLRPRQ